MQDDVLECRILVMPMRAPAIGAKVDLHVAGSRRPVANLNDGGAEIGSPFEIADPGMKDAEALPVQRLELRALKALMLPDGLKQSLGWRIGRIPQAQCSSLARTPFGIEASRGEGHLGLLLRWCFRKVKRREKEFLN